MTPQQYARVKELFHQARELSPESRDEFLRRECGTDVVLLEEVASLLRFDSTSTLGTPFVRPLVALKAQVGRPRGRLLSRIERATARLLQQLLGHPGHRLLVILFALLLLLGLAFWMYTGMKRSSQSIAAAELQTILNADVTALELWIEEKKQDIRLWSSRAEIRQAVNDLARIADTESDPSAKLLSAPAQARIRSVLVRFDRIVGRPEGDAVVNRDGLILAAARDERLGRRLNTEGIATLVPVFQGQTLFIKPHPSEAFGLERLAGLSMPVVYVVAPIRREDSDDSEVVAAAAFGFPADGEFTRIMSVARLGQTGETYAFDANGLLLSESRFDEALRASRLLPDDPESRSIFQIEVRDPGSESSRRPASSLEAAARPFTRLAAEAIAAGRKGGESDQGGVILEPYRNYRGARVIGAWKWLPAYSFAVATEVEVDEQYAPMRYPVIAEWLRFGLLAGCVASLLVAACWIAVLGRDAGRAAATRPVHARRENRRGWHGGCLPARHALLQRPTAIKLLRPEIVNAEALARFKREVQIASGLTHPNTIDIFDFGETPEGLFYCAMEFLTGTHAGKVVRRRRAAGGRSHRRHPATDRGIP